jgi:cell wall assembly regulator SMI1
LCEELFSYDSDKKGGCMPNPMMRIESWFSVNRPEFLEDLAPGCSEAALAETEALLGTVLPEDFKELYRRHDGQMMKYCWGLFYGIQFISLSKVRQEWLCWKAVIKDGLDDSPSFESAQSGAVKDLYASLRWIPFGIDSGGNSIGVDLDPGPSGTCGQVINFGRDEYEKFVLARSMSEFLDWFADQLESGNFLIQDEPMLMRGSGVFQELVMSDAEIARLPAAVPMWPSLSTKNPPGYNLLDAVRQLFAWQRGR